MPCPSRSDIYTTVRATRSDQGRWLNSTTFVFTVRNRRKGRAFPIRMRYVVVTGLERSQNDRENTEWLYCCIRLTGSCTSFIRPRRDCRRARTLQQRQLANHLGTDTLPVLWIERRRVRRPRGVAPSRCPTGNDALAARVERHTVGKPFLEVTAIHDRTKETEPYWGNDFSRFPLNIGAVDSIRINLKMAQMHIIGLDFIRIII